jgi:hypothetical protein
MRTIVVCVIALMGVCMLTATRAPNLVDESESIAGTQFNAHYDNSTTGGCWYSVSWSLACFESLQDQGVLTIDSLIQQLKESSLANDVVDSMLLTLREARATITDYRVSSDATLMDLHDKQKRNAIPHSVRHDTVYRDKLHNALIAAKRQVDSVKAEALLALN